MSNDKRKQLERATLKGPDGATPSASMELSGVVRTTKGYAMCNVKLAADGSVLAVSLSDSQAFKQHVATLAKRAQLEAALKA